MQGEREKHLEILKNMFTENVNYPFNGKEIIPFDSFLEMVLNNAERKYSDEFYWRKYPDFKKFLYSYEVDSIAYAVYIGDLE